MVQIQCRLPKPPVCPGLESLIEPLAAYINAADDQRSAWAVVIEALFAKVHKTNQEAEAYLKKLNK